MRPSPRCLVMLLVLGCPPPPPAGLSDDPVVAPPSEECEAEMTAVPAFRVEPAPMRPRAAVLHTPQEPDGADLVKEAAKTRESVTAVRCYLAHGRLLATGEGPENRKQPGLEVYEMSEDPCGIMPEYEALAEMQ